MSAVEAIAGVVARVAHGTRRLSVGAALAAGVIAIYAARTARVPFLLWHLTRLAGSSRELLMPHAAVLPLASVPFLLLSLWAVAAAVLEIVVALVLLVLLL